MSSNKFEYEDERKLCEFLNGDKVFSEFATCTVA